MQDMSCLSAAAPSLRPCSWRVITPANHHHACLLYVVDDWNVRMYVRVIIFFLRISLFWWCSSVYSISDQPPITPQLLLIVCTPVSKLPVIPATWAYGVLLHVNKGRRIGWHADTWTCLKQNIYTVRLLHPSGMGHTLRRGFWEEC